jgi:hypothetical protein
MISVRATSGHSQAASAPNAHSGSFSFLRNALWRGSPSEALEGRAQLDVAYVAVSSTRLRRWRQIISLKRPGGNR